MNLFEKLNRLDDSLVESKRIVKKKKLTESLATNEYKLTYYINTAARDRRPETTEDVLDDWKTVVFRADSDLDAWKEAFERVTGDYYDDFLDRDATEDDFSRYFEDSDWGDGSPILIKLSSAESVLYDTGYTQESWIEDYVEEDDYEDDYDDDIDEMLTEKYNDVTFESIADTIVDYAEKHPETLSNIRHVYDYIDDLNQEGVWYIPAALGNFVADDVNNISEDEAEEFIDMLIHKTNVHNRLIKIKKSNS